MSKIESIKDKALKPWNEVSADELQNREYLQEKEHNEPIRAVVARYEDVINRVWVSLGINPAGDMPVQQEIMGVKLMTDEEFPIPVPKGWYFLREGGEDGHVPYAWVSAVGLNHRGKGVCFIQWFVTDRQEEFEIADLTGFDKI